MNYKSKYQFSTDSYSCELCDFMQFHMVSCSRFKCLKVISVLLVPLEVLWDYFSAHQSGRGPLFRKIYQRCHMFILIGTDPISHKNKKWKSFNQGFLIQQFLEQSDTASPDPIMPGLASPHPSPTLPSMEEMLENSTHKHLTLQLFLNERKLQQF